MSTKIASSRQQELIGRAYEVVLVARHHEIALQLFTDWSKEVEHFLNQGRIAPEWLTRETDFDLFSKWFSDLVNTMNAGKVSLSFLIQ